MISHPIVKWLANLTTNQRSPVSNPIRDKHGWMRSCMWWCFYFWMWKLLYICVFIYLCLFVYLYIIIVYFNFSLQWHLHRWIHWFSMTILIIWSKHIFFILWYSKQTDSSLVRKDIPLSRFLIFHKRLYCRVEMSHA